MTDPPRPNLGNPGVAEAGLVRHMAEPAVSKSLVKLVEAAVNHAVGHCFI